MDELLHHDIDTPRDLTIIVAGFASLALLLSIIGIYGVMASFVQRHTKDIAIRIAVGGGPAAVTRSVVGRGLALVLIGVATGTAGALILTRYMAGLLYGIGTRDALTFSAVPALMLTVAMIACFVPARRAARVDPARVLREE